MLLEAERQKLRSLMTVYLKGVPRGRGTRFPVRRQGMYLVVCSWRCWGSGLFKIQNERHWDYGSTWSSESCLKDVVVARVDIWRWRFICNSHPMLKVKASDWCKREEASWLLESDFVGSTFHCAKFIYNAWCSLFEMHVFLIVCDAVCEKDRLS